MSGKVLEYFTNTHAHLHVNSGESVWWGKCVCMYMCVHQSEPLAISPPVCAQSLSFTLTHLSAPACPHHRRNPIRLKIMTRGTVVHQLPWLLMALFLFETFSPPVVPSYFFFFCFFAFLPPHVLTFVTEFVKRCYRFTGWQKAAEWARGLMGCVIFVYLSVCVWYQTVGRYALLLVVHLGPFTTNSWLGLISGSVRYEEFELSAVTELSHMTEARFSSVAVCGPAMCELCFVWPESGLRGFICNSDLSCSVIRSILQKFTHLRAVA